MPGSAWAMRSTHAPQVLRSSCPARSIVIAVMAVVNGSGPWKRVKSRTSGLTSVLSVASQSISAGEGPPAPATAPALPPVPAADVAPAAPPLPVLPAVDVAPAAPPAPAPASAPPDTFTHLWLAHVRPALQVSFA